MSTEPDYTITATFYGICEWCDYTSTEFYDRDSTAHAMDTHIEHAHPEASEDDA